MDDATLIARLNMIEAEIRHEDGLIGVRMSWLVISQSFLFESQQLDWPRLKKRAVVSLLGQLLPVAVSVGFLLAWLVILITMQTV